MKLTIFLFFTVLFTSSFNQYNKNEDSYSIVFGGCFQKDKVTIKINGVKIIENYEVWSSRVVRGISNLSIVQTRNIIQIRYNGKDISKPAIKLAKETTFDFYINNIQYHYDVNLKKGKILLVEFCNSQNTRGENLTLEQRKTNVLAM